ncbi:MAG TPA: DUF1937 family protein [Phycisphaerae bacterium]|nr:DUF1937 family protein [Phycisphaerae bacterium]
MIYLASPYSHPAPAVRAERFRLACNTAATLMQAGHRVFSPIAHTHPIAEAGGLPLGWDFWEQYDREMIAACTEVWVLPIDGWEQSSGVQAEIALARSLGLPVRIIDMKTGEPT